MQPSERIPSTAAVPSAADGQVLTLPASLDLTWADALHRELQERIGHDVALLIDGRDVDRVSTPCVQLLVAGALGARAHNLAFHITAASAVLAGAISDLGLGPVLGMETA